MVRYRVAFMTGCGIPHRFLPGLQPSRIHESKVVCTHRASRIEGSSHSHRKHAHRETPPGLAHPSAATCLFYVEQAHIYGRLLRTCIMNGHVGARMTVREFMSRYPDKAFDYLVRHFEDDPRVQAEINGYLTHPESGQSQSYELSRNQKGSYSTSPVDSHHHVLQLRHLKLHVPLRKNDTLEVPISRSAAPGVYTEVPVSYSIELTWLRSGADMTHKTTFHVVVSNLLDIDVLLGEGETGEYSSGSQPNNLPQTSRDFSHVSRGSSGNIPGYAQTPPVPSWHRSATCTTTDDSSTTTVQHQPSQHYQQPPPFLQPIFNQYKSPQHSSPIIKHPPRPTTQIDTSRSAQTPAVLAASTHQTSDPNAPISRIRLFLEWGRTPILLWLDLCASGDAFFQAFQKLALQRKRTLDRAETVLYLRQNKDGVDDEEYPLSLDEEELDADWGSTVAWLMENRRDKPPHIHGRVEVGEG
ncbi:predicted protein [Plenodomus lingam JN3]|uniref:Predicted protein n=1 Tax=Leptosphaeria maculans (strain JN3 / isolate v23.1.3 / race Av1-4-5-6-7-8) TaxID=985895 RepID=E5ADR2_LEPMJ|nr:predicted protein [Plenodomus lingam JN3]CBY01351.1 predicted protein [Plenodomus lingam JN3]